MPHHSHHPRYITTVTGALLVAIPVNGQRAVTKTLRLAVGESEVDLTARAVAWRDRAWRRLFGGAVPARSFHTNARAGSSTNAPGVRYVEKLVRKGGQSYVVPCILAEVHTIPGRDYARARGSRSRVYSLNKFEFGEAIALASAWRIETIRALADGAGCLEEAATVAQANCASR